MITQYDSDSFIISFENNLNFKLLRELVNREIISIHITDGMKSYCLDKNDCFKLQSQNILDLISFFEKNELDEKIISEIKNININLNKNIRPKQKNKFQKAKIDFLFNENSFNLAKKEKIIFDYINGDLNLTNLGKINDISKERVRQIISKFFSNLKDNEKQKIFHLIYLKKQKLDSAPLSFKDEINKYKLFLEKEIESFSYFLVLKNKKKLKVIDKDIFKNFYIPLSFLKINKKFLEINNIDELKDKYIFLDAKDDFEFDNKNNRTRKNIFNLVAYLYLDNNKIYTNINEILNIFIPFDKNGTNRSITGLLGNYQLLFSLGAGKYLIDYYIDEETNEKFKKIAKNIFTNIDIFFNNENIIVCDIEKFFLLAKSFYNFKNEHHLFFFLKKYSKDFDDKFSSFRSPIFFRKSEKENLDGKQTESLLLKQLNIYLTENNLFDKWIDKNDFLFDLNVKYGFKDYYILQHEHIFDNLIKKLGSGNIKGEYKFKSN